MNRRPLVLTATLCAVIAASAAPTAGAAQGKKYPPVEQYAMGVRYHQNGAEARALREQAYNIATMRLKQKLNTKDSKGKKPAVVLDIDETIVNNAPEMAAGVEQGWNYTRWGSHWQAWVDAAKAPLIPGAKKFLDYANQRGVNIFYVSNRVTKNQAPTVKNLKKLGLPQVSKQSVVLAGPPKEQRFNAIRKNHDILLYIGDSLHDFSAAFIRNTAKERSAEVTQMASKFGDKFIILPNAAYGAWTGNKLSAWQGQ